VADDEHHRLVEEARLDERAAAAVAEIPDEVVTALVAAWDTAVARQDADLRTAIDGGLSLLPRPLRSRVRAALGSKGSA
jgi:hypothetical protein